MRGRKLIGDQKLEELFAVRISKEQKEVIRKNKWIKKELDKQVREYLELFVMK